MVDAINTDYKNFYNNRKQKVTISNVCKWVPREKSKNMDGYLKF